MNKMKRVLILLVIQAGFVSSHAYVVIPSVNYLPVQFLSESKHKAIQDLSRNQFAGFGDHTRAMKALMEGREVNLKRFYKSKRKTVVEAHPTSFYVVKPLSEYSRILKENESEVYVLLDETLGYLQVVLMDTNDIKNTRFISGHVARPYYRSFKSFESDSKIELTQERILTFNILYKIMGWGRFASPYRNMAAFLWQQLQLMPFTGPKYVRMDPIRDSVEHSSFQMLKYNLWGSEERPESYKIPGPVTNYLAHWNNSYHSQIRGPLGAEYSALVFLPKNYSSSRIEVVNRFNQHSTLYMDMQLLGKLCSFDQIKDTLPVILKAIGFLNDTTQLKVRINGKDTVVRGIGYELNEFSQRYSVLENWTGCEYLCPFLFVKYDNALTVSGFEILVDARRNRTTIRYKGTYDHATTVRELIEIK